VANLTNKNNTADISIERLPSFPKVALDLFNRLQSTTSNNQEITRLLSSDAGITAKVLKLANSGYYSIPGAAKDVGRALQFLGFNTVSQIILTASIPQLFKSHGTASLPMKSLWKRNLAIAVAAELLAKINGHSKPAEAFTVGLLYHVGKLAFVELYPMDFEKIHVEAKHSQMNFDEIAIQSRMTTTVALNKKIAEQWNFPKPLVAALDRSNPDASKWSPLGQIAWQASNFVHFKQIGDSGDYRPIAESQIDPKCLQSQFLQQFEQQFDRAGAFLYG
jgi:two-component system, cell cycle response regulator